MKKKIYKYLSVAFIAVAMAVSFQMRIKKANSYNNLSIVALHIALAEQAENDPDGDHCSSEPNHLCYVGSGLSFEGCDEDTWYTLSDCF